MAQHQQPFGPRLVFRERASQKRGHTQHGKRIAGHPGKHDLDRLAVCREGDPVSEIVDERDILERRDSLAPVLHVGRRRVDLLPSPLLIGLPQHHEAIGRIERKGPQHDLVDGREDGRRGADSQAERQQHDQGESRRTLEVAEGEPNVLKKSAHERASSSAGL